MAHILIVDSRRTQRHTLAELLEASGHHVVTTADAVLGLAALRVSLHPLITLIGEQSGSLGVEDVFELAADGSHASTCPETAPQHAYILMTSLPSEAWSDTTRMLVAQHKATILPSTCSVGMLLAAVDEAEERMHHTLAIPCAVAVSYA